MKSTALLLCTILMSSCATIFNRGNPTLITTNPNGAKVVITDKNQTVVHQGVSPTSANLKASAGFFKAASYNVSISKKGYPKRNMELRSDISGWYFGNILIGGLIGMVIIDPATGAMWKMPADYNVNLQTLATIKSNDGNTLAVVDGSSLTAEQKTILIPVSKSL
jgi:hypothetical protein